jgi:hypothetical protein
LGDHPDLSISRDSTNDVIEWSFYVMELKFGQIVYFYST